MKDYTEEWLSADLKIDRDEVTGTSIPLARIEKRLMAGLEQRMAGRAFAAIPTVGTQGREPVQVCNLQTDDSGIAEPGARETMMEGAVAAPVIGSDGTLEGTIGIAKPEPYEFTPAERDQLLRAGARTAQQL